MPTGYARSKLVAEHVLQNAVERNGADTTILRIGQIVPSERTGSRLWNPSEMIPLMVRSALSTGALPDVPAKGGSDMCSWIKTDVLVRTVMEIAGLVHGDSGVKEEERIGRLVYNIVHPRPLSWKSEFLQALREAGLNFEVVGWEEWLQRLERSEGDVEKNPSRKLLDFWKNQTRGDRKTDVVFETDFAENKSETLRNAGAVVAATYVTHLLEAWQAVW